MESLAFRNHPRAICSTGFHDSQRRRHPFAARIKFRGAWERADAEFFLCGVQRSPEIIPAKRPELFFPPVSPPASDRTMTFDFNSGGGGDAALLEQFGFDPRDRFSYSAIVTATPPQATISSSALNTMSQASRQSLSPGTSWLPLEVAGVVGPSVSIHSPNNASAAASSPEEYQAQSPAYHSHSSTASSPLQQQPSPFQTAAHPALMADWPLRQPPAQQQQQSSADLSQFIQDSTLMGFNPFTPGFQPSPLEFLPPGLPTSLTGSLPQTMPRTMPTALPVTTTHAALGASMRLDPAFSTMSPVEDTSTLQWGMGMANWPGFETAMSFPSDGLPPLGSLGSNSPTGSCLEVPSLNSGSDNASSDRNCFGGDTHQQAHDIISPAAAVGPMPIKATVAMIRPTPTSGAGSVSPPARRNSAPRKSPTAKSTKAVIRRTSTNKKDGTGEKKVGRRKGPLLPEQRKQASEIRKLRACLRCKFLKKTCDKGEPCAGCQPSHARLWQVPCTRIDIKDIGYFMKDWKADYERHLGRGVSVFNVKGFAQKETLMWITHGYGFCLPVNVREVFVADESCFQADWVESWVPDQEPIEFETRTERLDVGRDGISLEALSEYLDKHIDGPFETFIDDHFEGTPFITEILKTAHRYYVKEKLAVIRKALKLILAYNLTLRITMVEQPATETPLDGQIDDEDSKFFGKVIAPVMINFQIKCAMADMWRELQRDILEELSALYSSVYSGDRLKNWPTIFMLASILLAVWEEMQFDCHYRVPDPIAVNKFCTDMETTPVGVIVGLFHAISQKLPAFTEWDTRKHGPLLNNNVAVCEAMTEVRQHVIKHETYLRTRQDTKFDRYDFDSLSNKFLSKLVIRAT
ncbi:hypothetical protein P8C59_007771 [Phyllachora maydis]|uniref:C6 finger domain protein n=1 Tax=Phyllachora maydis TaxID=1825666 RepID=A0AAD9MIS9_9PEZI|nr:hypothetical protein P8C59_007771 [Phyllachora maydis]